MIPPLRKGFQNLQECSEFRGRHLQTINNARSFPTARKKLYQENLSEKAARNNAAFYTSVQENGRLIDLQGEKPIFAVASVGPDQKHLVNCNPATTTVDPKSRENDGAITFHADGKEFIVDGAVAACTSHSSTHGLRPRSSQNKTGGQNPVIMPTRMKVPLSVAVQPNQTIGSNFGDTASNFDGAEGRAELESQYRQAKNLYKLPDDAAASEIISRLPPNRGLQVFDSRVAAAGVHPTHLTASFQIASDEADAPALVQLAFPHKDIAVFLQAWTNGNVLVSEVTPQDLDPDTPDPERRPTITFFNQEMKIIPLRSVLPRSRPAFLDWGIPAAPAPMETDSSDSAQSQAAQSALSELESSSPAK